MRLWIFWLHNRWRVVGAGAVALIALLALALLSWSGPALGVRLLGNADAPRAAAHGASGTLLPRSGNPRANPAALADAHASVLDAPAPTGAGPQTIAEAQARWSTNVITQHQDALLKALNCARQARQLPAVTLDAQLTQTAGIAWLRLMHEPSFSLMELPGTYAARSVLPLSAQTSTPANAAPTEHSAEVDTPACVVDGFDPATLPLTSASTHIGIAVFPPQATWDMASAVILVQ